MLSFYFEDSDEGPPLLPAPVLQPSLFELLNEILNFPTESTNAYSYARLLPNLLALRLNVLKRSLEILIDRPELIYLFELSLSLPLAPHTPITSTHALFNPKSRPPQPEPASPGRIKIETNASSAALAAFFRNHEERTGLRHAFSKRSSSLNTPLLLNNSRVNFSADPSTFRSPLPPQTSSGDAENTPLYESIREKLRQMILLLSTDSPPSSAIALDLHDLLLSNVHDESKERGLQRRLLYALATPFYESILTGNIVNLNRNILLAALPKTIAPPLRPARVPLKKYNSFDDLVISSPARWVVNCSTARPFHLLSTSKKINPQAIVTCDALAPWALKGANDLLTLIFGLDASLCGLLDLIDRKLLDFVQLKLEKRLKRPSGNVIFAGEIVAVRGRIGVSWCLLWAKRRGDVLILMFDQIPCAAIDLTVSRKDSWLIESAVETSDHLFSGLELENKPLKGFSNSLASQLDKSGCVDELNERRYYTLNLEGQHVPCAVYAEPSLESLLVLKIHSLPYIAGIFVVSLKDYTVLSHNRSISKNLFGHGDLIGKPVLTVIPNFKTLLEFLLSTKKVVNFLTDLADKLTPERRRESSLLPLLPGLVLPEHFFRRIQAKFEAHKLKNLRTGVLEEELEDELFLESKGIEGRHADGSNLCIDVQLRVSTIDTLVLWVTYSNNLYKRMTHSPSETGFLRCGSLKKKKQELDTELEEVSLQRNNSLLSNLSVSEEDLKTQPGTAETAETTETAETANTAETDKAEEATESPENTDTTGEDPETKLVIKSEEELAVLDTEGRENWKRQCAHFPETIGAQRRTKKVSQFQVLKKMGEGAYGKVLLVSAKNDRPYKVVLKCIYKERILVDSWTRDRKLGLIPTEIQVMAFLNTNPHPNTLMLMDFFEDDEFFYVELPIHGHPAIELFDYIEIKKRLSEAEIRYVFRQIVHAVRHLHRNGIVHRDIKDENVIIDENLVAKLIDYGLAAFSRSGPFKVFVGTMEYAPPEVLHGSAYDGRPQDIWSLGVLLYTMVYKENPFYNVDEIMEGELKVPYVLSEGCVRLITRMLDRDMERRPTIEQIADDRWINE